MNTIPHTDSILTPKRTVRVRVNDPLVRAQRKAYLASETYKLDQLLEEETRWKRKLTIASNKLQDVRDRINKFAKERVKV